MKRFLLPLLAAWFLLPIWGGAEENIALDRDAVYAGMSVSWNNGYAPQIRENVMTLHFPIRTGADIDQITAEIIQPFGAPTPFSGQGLHGTFSRGADALYHVTLKPQVYAHRINGDYACVLRVTGKDVQGEIPFTLRIRDGQAPAESLRPCIDNVRCDLKVGEDAVLTASIANPGRYAALRNLLLTVSDPSGEILPKGSSILPLGELMPGENMEISAPLTVRADAGVALHTVKLAFAYTVLDADKTWEESFTLPVNQEIRMELGELALPATALQGGTANLALPIMNLGRGKLVNVMARLTLPGVTDGQTVLVGTIEPGATGTAKMTFTPGREALGDLSGSLTIQCEDAWGNRASRELPVSLTVEKAPEVRLPLGESGPEEKERPAWLLPALMAACGILLIACILEAVLWSGKVRRLEEEKL